MFINSNVAVNSTVTASFNVSVSVIDCPSVRGIVIRTVNGFVFLSVCPKCRCSRRASSQGNQSVPSVDALRELRPMGTG